MRLCDRTGAPYGAPWMQACCKLIASCSLLVFLCIPCDAQQTRAATSNPAIQKSGHIVFQDYFNDGNDDGWTQINRGWHVLGGRYVQDGDYLPDAIGRGGWTLTHTGDRAWRDYVLQATFDVTNVPGLPSPDVHAALFLVRVQTFAQPGVDVGLPTGGTYYAVNVWPRGTSDPRTGCTECILPDGLVGFAKMVNGEQTVTFDREYSNAVVGTNTITIELAGKRIRVWINGEQVLSIADPEPLRYGGVGLASIWEAEVWYDNVIVSGNAKR